MVKQRVRVVNTKGTELLTYGPQSKRTMEIGMDELKQFRGDRASGK